MTDLCPRCGKPILEGQPRYTIDESHYECKERDDRKLSEGMVRLQSTTVRVQGLIDRLRRNMK